MKRFASSLVLAGLVCATLMMTGCDRHDTDALVARAEQAYLNKEYRSATLDLKTVLRENPQHARARWVLSEVYLALGDGASAAKELRRAGELGVGREAVLPALHRALLLQRKFRDLLALEFDAALSPTAQAQILAMRVLAYLETDENDDAKETLQLAEQKDAQAVDVLYARARMSVVEEQSEQAMAEVLAINEQHPEYGAAWALRGDLHLEKDDFPAAEEAFTKAIGIRPFEVEDRSKRALVRASMGKRSEAEEDAKVLQRIAPKYHMGHYLIGAIRLQDGQLEQAKEALERALNLSPQHFQTVFALAFIETRLGNSNRARQLAGQAAAAQPNYIPARMLMAHWLIRDEKGAEAERLIRPVTVVRPEDTGAMDLLAASLLVQGKTDEAADLLKRLADENTDDFEAQLRAGTGLLEAGDAAEGTKLLKRAVGMSPMDPTANTRLVAGLMQEQNTSEGLRAAEAYVERKPDDPAALNLLATAYVAAGDRDAAVATYERALQMEQGNLEASRRLAGLALADENPEKAIEYTKAGLAQHPADLPLLLIQADAAKGLDDVELQEATLQKAVSDHPNELGPKALMANLLLQRNDPEKALLLVADVSDRTHSGVLFARADAYYRLNRLSEARRDLEALAMLMPESLELQYQLARIYDALGDIGGLDGALNRVLDLAPGDTRALVTKARLAVLRDQPDEARALLESPEVKAMGEIPDVLTTWVALAQRQGDGKAEAVSAGKLYAQEANKRHLLMLSRASIRAGNVAETEEVLSQWLQSHPDDVDVLSELANVYVGQERIDDAVEKLRKIEALDKNNVYALNNLAWYLREQMPGEARTFGRRAYELAPEQPTVVDTYAAVLAENKDFRGALDVVDRAIQRSNQPFELQLRRVRILDQSGENEMAVEELQRLLDGSLSDQEREEAEVLQARIKGED